MTRVVLAVASDLAADDALREMRRARVHHLIVVDHGHIVGIVSDRDLGGVHGEPVRANRTVADLMSPDVLTTTPATSIPEVANLLRSRRIGCLPVVDGGTLVGIVTTNDLLELVGTGVPRPPGDSEQRILRDRGPHTRAYAVATAK